MQYESLRKCVRITGFEEENNLNENRNDFTEK
jgi:hypothetical protein